ncbi:phage portal protein [uncultured Tateyamaria sp.]|uniref:phage portal protein n=1 Tax=uncultured Tateyamaria sp. TaxID=455651 RepID=UPI00262EF480|nr:phage portal protein [uncultured Tateyamaria sp.]
MALHWTDKALAVIAPQAAMKRVSARVALRNMTAYYDAASSGGRTGSWRKSRGDANASGGRRARLSFISRDMVRNNPIATGVVQTIVSHTVGKGIMPKLEGIADEDLLKEGKARLESHLKSKDIDWRGRETLAGLQRLLDGALVTDGEVLVILHPGTNGTYPKIEILEIDHLDDGAFRAGADGNYIQDGIEYSESGHRVAYHVFDEHPGAQGWINWKGRAVSRRVPAKFVLHVYRQDRPGQERGVSWFAPVALPLQDLADYEDAQLMRQKIAACFTVFRHTSNQSKQSPASLSPGAIVDVSGEDGYEFASPPGVEGYDEFTRGQLRRIAKGVGITYEACSGDLSNVNFSSAKMGRMEMDRNVEAWQWLILIAQFLEPLGRMFLQAWALERGYHNRMAEILAAKVDWVPPARILIDPAKELPPLVEEVRAGFNSRQRAITSLGRDADQIHQEQIEDMAQADRSGLIYDSDGRYHAKPAPPVAGANQEQDENG